MSEAEPKKSIRRWTWSLPLIVFAGLAGLFWFALGNGNPHRLPSALIGKHVPKFVLQPIPGVQNDKGFSSADLADGKATIVNVWASWCMPCHEEHPFLVQLMQQHPNLRLYGINYKDNPSTARRFLGRFGDPYKRLGADRSGRVAISWGVYGVPETYIVNGDGIVTYRHVGPLTPQSIRTDLLPRLKKAEEKLSSAEKPQP